MDKLKLIKTIVFVLTFLLVFGTLALLGSVYKRTHREIPNTAIITSLEQPQGSEITEFKVDNQKIYVLVKKGGLADRIVVYDHQNHRLINHINLQ